MFYSFLGFLLEVAFARVTHNPKRDRKCFYFLPLCPVYGLGALLILAPAPLLSRHIVLLALWSAFAATTAKYLMSLLYEIFLHVSFWDYSHLPFQIHGRVCLLFSLFWCGLGLLLVYGVQPLVAEIVSSIPGWLTLPTALFLGLDAVFTVYVLRRDRPPTPCCGIADSRTAMARTGPDCGLLRAYTGLVELSQHHEMLLLILNDPAQVFHNIAVSNPPGLGRYFRMEAFSSLTAMRIIGPSRR